MLFDEHCRLKKNGAENPELEVILEGKCPIQRTEKEKEITNIVKASDKIIKKVNFSIEEEHTTLGE